MKNKRIIKQNITFQKIISKSNKIKNFHYVIYHIENKDFLKYGISVGKKIGNAVTRNHIKNQIRMMMKDIILNYGDINKSIIIVARKPISNISFEKNFHNLKSLFSKLK